MQVKKNEAELAFLRRLMAHSINEQSRRVQPKKILAGIEETLRIRILYLKKGKIVNENDESINTSMMTARRTSGKL